MTYDDCDHHACHHDGCGSLAWLRCRQLRQQVLRLQRLRQVLDACRQFVACEPMQHLQLQDLPSCPRVADLEVRCLEPLVLGVVVEALRTDLAPHLQHVFCCGYDRHAFRVGAFSHRPEFREYVVDQSVVRCPVAARGLAPLRSFHSLCLLVSCIGYRTNAASLPTLCNIVAVQRFNQPQRGVACRARIAIA